MRPYGIDTDPHSLVPFARLGAALFRHRSRRGLALGELVRTAEHRWSTERLEALERGEAALDDGAVAEVVELYGLPETSWNRPGRLALMLDRTTVSGFSSSGLSVPDPGFLGGAIPLDRAQRWLAVRTLAAAIIAGVDLCTESFALDPFAEGAGLAPGNAAGCLMAVLEQDSAAIRHEIDAMAGRTVVPGVGVAVGTTPSGTLMLRGAGVDEAARTVSPVGRFEDLLGLLVGAV